MAVEFKLPYSAEDISNRLGNVTVNMEEINQLKQQLEIANSAISERVLKSRTINGKTLNDDIVLSAVDIKADVEGSAAQALENARAYADTKFNAESLSRADGDAATLNSATVHTNEKISKEISDRNTAISNHNTSTAAHNDIRILLSNLITKVNTLLDSDDTTLDQLSEVVSYIKDNRELIEGITTDKINVSDIVDNLTTNSSNKVLSAAQGTALKDSLDNLTASVNTKSTVSASQSLSSGTQIGAITIDGATTKLYAPTKTNISVNSTQLIITT